MGKVLGVRGLVGSLVIVAAGLSSCATTQGGGWLSELSADTGQRAASSDPMPVSLSYPPVPWDPSGAAAYAPPIGALPFSGEALSPTQQRLLQGARFVLGKPYLEVRGRRFTYDCTGTILAIYYYAGINLAARFVHYTGDGVHRLYKIMRAHDLLYTSYYPKPGDIIFWNNTYDANGDGKWDDPLTHAGMVVGVSSNGEITYIHQNYRKGIIIERMNLLYPSIYTRIVDGLSVIVNSPMRMRGSPPGPGWLSGQLFDSLGKGYLLPS